MKKEKGIIYILENEIGMVKIGITKNLKTRLGSIQTATGLKITKVYSYEHDDFRTEEARLHLKYDKQRMLGEWFKIDYNFVINGLECDNISTPEMQHFIIIPSDLFKLANEVPRYATLIKSNLIKLYLRKTHRGTVATDTKNRSCNRWKDLLDILKIKSPRDRACFKKFLIINNVVSIVQDSSGKNKIILR